MNNANIMIQVIDKNAGALKHMANCQKAGLLERESKSGFLNVKATA
jgi:hypothetical protein